MANRRYLLVDGHSVIFSWPELRALHNKRTASARQVLIEQLERLHDGGLWAVTLVFDGKIGATPVRPPNAMAVCYASAEETADSIIEKLVGAHSPAKEIWVVTADEAERQTIEALGASAVSPAWLQDELLREEDELHSTLKKINRRAEWN